MIKDIGDIEYNQKELSKCNKILNEIWTDSSAEQFKKTYQGPIEAAGTVFVSESIGHVQLLNRELEELDSLKSEFNQLVNELQDICNHPSWNGCGIGIVEGNDELKSQLHCQEFFVVPKEEMPYLNNSDVMARLAIRQVTTLEEHENPRFYTSLY